VLHISTHHSTQHAAHTHTPTERNTTRLGCAPASPHWVCDAQCTGTTHRQLADPAMCSAQHQHRGSCSLVSEQQPVSCSRSHCLMQRTQKQSSAWWYVLQTDKTNIFKSNQHTILLGSLPQCRPQEPQGVQHTWVQLGQQSCRGLSSARPKSPPAIGAGGERRDWVQSSQPTTLSKRQPFIGFKGCHHSRGRSN
jgi:hypothetical protein